VCGTRGLASGGDPGLDKFSVHSSFGLSRNRQIKEDFKKCTQTKNLLYIFLQDHGDMLDILEVIRLRRTMTKQRAPMAPREWDLGLSNAFLRDSLQLFCRDSLQRILSRGNALEKEREDFGRHGTRVGKR